MADTEVKVADDVMAGEEDGEDEVQQHPEAMGGRTY
jgi:hypothetical protein